eukprot:jgi/Mesen1/8299/ME000451S07507
MWEGGGKLVERPVEYTPDGKRILCCSGKNVLIFSVATGEQVGVLRGHKDLVTTVVAMGFASSAAKVAVHHCWTASLDGTVRLWDYATCALMRTVSIGFRIESMALPALRQESPDGGEQARHLLAYLSVWWTKGSAKEGGVEQSGRVIVVNLINGQRIKGHLSKTLAPRRLVVSPKGGLVGQTDKHKAYVWRTDGAPPDTAGAIPCSRLHHTKPLWVLAFGPNENEVAAGDASGRILVWHKFGEHHLPWGRDARASKNRRNKELKGQGGRPGGKSPGSGGQSDGEGGPGEGGRLDGQPQDVEMGTGGEDDDASGGEASPGPSAAKKESRSRRGNMYVADPLGNQRENQAGVRGVDNAEACTTYHWHAHGVRVLAYSEDGVYLLSGGQEQVLVMWQLETGARQYLPRLGGALVGLCPSPLASVYAVQCDDNTVKVINMASISIERTIQGVRSGVAAASKKRRGRQNDLEQLVVPTDAVLEPRRGRLVLPTQQAGLQLLYYLIQLEGKPLVEVPIAADVSTSHFATCCLHELQVVLRNYVQRTDTPASHSGADTSAEPPVSVSHVAFSHDGSAMATVEVRIPEEDIGRGTTLKFWDLRPGGPAPASQSYQVNTRVDEPHGGVLSALSAHPFESMAVSCSLDGEFKVWVKSGGKKRLGEDLGPSIFWRCRSVGSYRGDPILAACFSPDGSLLAVTAGDAVTLWSPETNGLLCVLPSACCALPEQPISRAHFASSAPSASSAPFLVTYTGGLSPTLAVWNLLTMSVWWSSRLGVSALVVDGSAARFAVLSLAPDHYMDSPGHRRASHASPAADGYIILFNFSDPRPVAAWHLARAEGASLLFAPHGSLQKPGVKPVQESKKESHLVILTTSREYVVIEAPEGGDEEEEGESAGEEEQGGGVGSKPASAAEETSASGFEAMYGKTPSRSKKSSKKASREKEQVSFAAEGEKSSKPWGNLLSGPSHILPPLTRIYPTFMEAMLEKLIKSDGV